MFAIFQSLAASSQCARGHWSPRTLVPIGRPARLTPPRSPLAITGLAVLPAQLHLMSNFRLTAGSQSVTAQTTSLRKRDIRGSWAITRHISRGLHCSMIRSSLRCLRSELRRLFSQTPYRSSRYFAASSKPPRPGAHTRQLK